jgi:hypothetical protein
VPAKSTIRKLPPELRAELDRLLADGRFTLRDVTAHMRELGADVSKSAVHRYSQNFEEVAKDIRLAREMAQAIGKELEAMPDGDSGRLAIESLQALLLRARMQIAKDDELDVDEFSSLARAAKDLQSALKSNVDVEIKIRERAAKDAARAAEKVATERGLTSETIEAIKGSILGISSRSP